ncbi:glutathione S-transferase family protein [Thalassotalea sp. M1531]|uniref:Glutathione S-transferase family protein n=1 Tax=Thalassotalea algicola TaxID=2716224 RepID=A0A7Y0L970_9GAMM|nr:glutathione S-transferase family protein [Thalassotalea algicola]NMP30294.1 glutathione S-transferase family protein [Thalassotalea algicola]
MQLLGSTTSPYVRRIRLLFELIGQEYQFDNLDIFSESGREILKKNNPTLKVPALIDGSECVYDSRVIFRYLSHKFELAPISWAEENNLTLIDAANDSLVALLISTRSGLNVNDDVMFFNIQHERIENIYQLLDKQVAQGDFDQWNYPAICLYCLLDWASFRELKMFEEFSSLSKFVAENRNKVGVLESAPDITI